MTTPPFCQGPEWKPRRSAKESGTCGACGAALVGRNCWFCPSPRGEAYFHDGLEGESCRARYMRNHLWGEARAAAIRRDGGRCRRCGIPLQDAQGQLEVNHIEPRNGQGYGLGCWNHLDAVAWDFALLVGLNVCSKCLDTVGVLLQKAQGSVALCTENRPDDASCMVVVYMRADFLEAAFADGTHIPLGLKQVPILRGAEAIDQSEVRCLSSTLPRTKHGVTPSQSAAATEQACHGVLTPLTPVARFASLIAVEATVSERTATLQASTRRNGVPTEGGNSLPPKPRVVGLTEGSAFPHREGLTSINPTAWQVVHNVIIQQVPLQDMPPVRPGLETLCHNCHLLTTAGQRGFTPGGRSAARRRERATP